MPLKKKLILVTENMAEQLKIAKLINSLSSKIINNKYIGDEIKISLEEAQMIQDIVVSSNPQ